MPRAAKDDQSPDEVALANAAAEIYRAAPQDFVATRKAAAKDARANGDKSLALEITSLRKPTQGADALNRVVHAQHPVLADIAEVGAHLRHAQSAMDTASLTKLRPQRDAVIEETLQAIGGVTDGPLSDALKQSVRDSLIAAFADAAAQEVVLSGMLTRTLSYSGFGEVDVTQAAARTSTGTVLTAIVGGGQSDADEAPELDEGPDLRQRRAQEAKAQRDREAEQARTSAAKALAEAEREMARAEAEVIQSSRLLHAAQQRLNEASNARDAAAKAVKAAK
ncbi:hypothetical protein K0651_12565 [Ornithinimicrobium sp. Arc0846-15]|nr:hypothetical protein [Ornithinimicrobium laminariae]